MKATDMNIFVASISNYLYECLEDDDFDCLALFLAELSKSMFSMSIFERFCDNDNTQRKRVPLSARHAVSTAAASAARADDKVAEEVKEMSSVQETEKEGIEAEIENDEYY